MYAFTEERLHQTVNHHVYEFMHTGYNWGVSSLSGVWNDIYGSKKNTKFAD